MIYLKTKLQQRLIPLFHYALHRDGVLLLGSADTPGHSSEPFAPLTATPRRGLPSNPQVLALAQQLIDARHDIHAVRNDMQTSRDGIKPAKEEWQASNEELSSVKILEAQLRQIQSGAVANGKERESTS
ncbi:hypothetical protein ACQ4WY_05775 [Janthinobacterium sp. LB2P49]|uniref:hypothetical protein n=1 Tax=Janthinobacterium sp. LB2P49 TaxID=3424198 RepID=UPI00336C17AF